MTVLSDEATRGHTISSTYHIEMLPGETTRHCIVITVCRQSIPI